MITPEQCRAGRAMLQWSREYLAEQAGISGRTLIDFERGARNPLKNNLRAIREALEKGGISFTDNGCVCPPKKGKKS